MSGHTMQNTRLTRKLRDPFPKILAFLAISICLVYCTIRGPLRGKNSNDFAAPYVASHRLLVHSNPYTPKRFNEEWHALGANPKVAVNDSGIRPVYPPTTLVLVAPMTLLKWSTSLQLLIWGSLALYCLLLFLLSQEITGIAAKTAFICISLCLTSLQTALHTGNLSLPAFLACGFAIVFLSRNRPFLAGALLALGCGLKPTIGFTLILLLLVRRSWKAAASLVVVLAAVAAIGAHLVEQLNPIWRVDYQSNLAYLFGDHGAACFLSECELRYQLINLQVLFESFLQSATAANICSYAVTAALAAAWAVLYRRNKQLQWFDAVAPLMLLCLLPLYQRSYSGIVVVFAILSVFASAKPIGKVFPILMIWFLLPVEEILRLKIQPHIPLHIVHGPLWIDLVMPSQNWVVLILTILFLGRMLPDSERRSFPFENETGKEYAGSPTPNAVSPYTKPPRLTSSAQQTIAAEPLIL